MSTRCPQCQTPLPANALRCSVCKNSLGPVVLDPNLGRSVGNLRLVSRLGVGALGTVYRAEHHTLGTPYAIKVLHPELSGDESLAERFRHAAVACSRLRHENTVFMTDFGVDQALGMYIVMEFIDGATLKQLLKSQGRFSLGRFARVGEQVCDAMSAGHRAGIVHRDLKPESVMVLADLSRRDFVKVLEFGMAQLRSEGAELVEASTYVSPEQIDDRITEVGPASDIYSLGVTFYEMLAGVAPFVGASDALLREQHLMAAPEPLSTHRPDLAESRLEGLLGMMLAKKPTLRPSSMDEVRSMLGAAIDELRALGVSDVVYEAVAMASPPDHKDLQHQSSTSRVSIAPGISKVSRPPPAPSPQEAVTDEGLIEKLKKPMTVDNLKAVLGHRFNLFGKKSDKL